MATGCASFLITTSSVELPQVPLVSVQRRVIFVLNGTVVIVVVADVAFVITDVPPDPTKLHAPVPALGTAAMVKVDVLHNV